VTVSRTLCGLALSLAAAAAPAQEKPAPPPVFGVGVDIVAVDVSVVDAQGRPARGLATEDFTLNVDGRPRRVASVEYVDLAAAATTAPAPASSGYSTNEGARTGRLVMIAIDAGSIGRGGARPVTNAADRLLDALTPEDRVALVAFPAPGPTVPFTQDPSRVREALKGVVGRAERGGTLVGLADALALVDPQDFRRQEALERACGTASGGKRERDACENEALAQAAQVVADYRERSTASYHGLAAILEGLASIEGPKTLVLISEGLGTRTSREIHDLAAAASRAQVTLYVLRVETSSGDASIPSGARALLQDRGVESEGLENLASYTRGTIYRVIGAGGDLFGRIARELEGYYLLGFEPEGGDRDGKEHSVQVQVSRPGVTVHARSLVTIPAAAPGQREVLTAALRSPLVQRGLALRVTSFALPDPAPGKVRVLVAADVARASRPVALALALVGPHDAVAASRMYQGVGAETSGDRVPFVGDFSVEPAVYRLRLAALDAAGRRGSVDHQVKAALTSAGGVEISDLLLGPLPPAGQALEPAIDVVVEGGEMLAHLEVTGRDRSRLGETTVTLEVAESETGPSIVEAPVRMADTEGGRARTAQADLAAGLLPPGSYVARAVVALGGKRVAAVTRPFRVEPPRVAAGPSQGPLAALGLETRPFDRAELLRPEVLGHFLDRMAELAPGATSPPLGEALALARAGQSDRMLDRLGGAAKEDVRFAFLRGIALYARGNLPGATTQLQEALRLQSDFLPAAVYLGGCYAAGGKDADAIGAWQTALIGENGSAAVYAMLGDALLREKDGDQAIDVLKEGLQAWPDDEGLKRRIALSYALAGRREQALPLLLDWVDRHPEDRVALFATLALLFQAFTQEAAGTAHPVERERLLRYAKAYVDGQGPNRQVVEQWLKYLRSQPAK
jgi:VWFA-related protein